MAVRGRTVETVSIEGFAELDRQLRENLPKATQSAVLRRAGSQAMEPMADQARALVPSRTGRLRSSIRVTAKFLRKAGSVLVQIGAGDRDAFYARFVERGTVKMAAEPYLRPAFDGQATATIGRLKTAIRAEIDKAVARRAKRLAKRG